MGDWKVLFGAEGLYGSTHGETTSQAWDVHLQANYNISPKLYWYTGARYDDDAFSGFAYQTAVKTGVGYQFYNTDTTKLTVQAGVGYRWLRKEYLVKDAAGGVTERTNPDVPTEQRGVRRRGDLRAQLQRVHQAARRGERASSSDNTLTTATIALQVKMSNRLALAAGYQLTQQQQPPAGSGHRDTLTTLSLVYDMKNPKLAPE